MSTFLFRASVGSTEASNGVLGPVGLIDRGGVGPMRTSNPVFQAAPRVVAEQLENRAYHTKRADRSVVQ